MESAGEALFYGDPIMRAKLAMTAFKMPGHLFSAIRIHGTPDRIKQGALLLSASNFFRNKFHTIAVFQDATSLCLEELYQSNFTVAKSCCGSSSFLFQFTLQKSVLYSALVEMDRVVRKSFFGTF